MCYTQFRMSQILDSDNSTLFSIDKKSDQQDEDKEE
uniref:ORF7 n=1 Tax=Nitrosopumilaceae spindle-shaped virus TaxID=3065433 RepID=A0AAT9J764_9VIRU